ncbi:Zinc finger PHD-type [Penicillium cf. griseofulvum]|nr:Zinc finger PHD-type [Penicillium cf. griseofulvum]
MQPFDPVGTTVHEERWTGRDVMRGMSEELSELDEDELEGLKDLVDDGELKGETTAPAVSQQNTRRTRRLRGSR